MGSPERRSDTDNYIFNIVLCCNFSLHFLSNARIILKYIKISKQIFVILIIMFGSFFLILLLKYFVQRMWPVTLFVPTVIVIHYINILNIFGSV